MDSLDYLALVPSLAFRVPSLFSFLFFFWVFFSSLGLPFPPSSRPPPLFFSLAQLVGDAVAASLGQQVSRFPFG